MIEELREGICADMVVEFHSDQEALLPIIAPQLKRLQDRLWTLDESKLVSYPTAAHARMASIEDSSFWFRYRNQVIVTFLRKNLPAGPFLDIGGGNGSVSLALERCGISTIVVEPGVDGSQIAHARGLTVIRATFSPELFVPGSVSAIGLFDVIEHVADDMTFLKHCREVLSDGGSLYITVPALRSLWSSDDKFAGHYRRYNRKSLKHLLFASGFEVLTLSAFFSLLVPPVFMLRTLPSFVGLRKAKGVDQALIHHWSEYKLGRLMEYALGFEHAWLARGQVFPFGTSLIAVARKSSG